MFIIVSVTMKLIYIKIQFTNVVHISSAFINRRVQFSNVVHTNDGLEYNVKLLTNTNITSRSVIHVCPYCIQHIWDRLNCFKVNKIENIT